MCYIYSVILGFNFKTLTREESVWDSDSRALFAFMASLGLHFLLLTMLAYIEKHGSVSKRDDPLEIVLQDPRQSPRFVQADNDILKEKPEKRVRFQSDKTRRTKLETWRYSQTRLQAPMSSMGGAGRPQSLDQAKPYPRFKDSSGARKRKVLKLPGLGVKQSTPPNFVQQRLPPGVQLGNATILNTDQNRFYSFHQRLISRFIPIWGLEVTRAMQEWLRKNSKVPISKRWITQLEVIMDEKGEILEVQPFRLSGLWSVDHAAIDSFKQVRNVPNPPSEMVDDNGYIHLQFQTEVLWVPQPGMRFQGGDP